MCACSLYLHFLLVIFSVLGDVRLLIVLTFSSRYLQRPWRCAPARCTYIFFSLSSASLAMRACSLYLHFLLVIFSVLGDARLLVVLTFSSRYLPRPWRCAPAHCTYIFFSLSSASLAMRACSLYLHFLLVIFRVLGDARLLVVLTFSSRYLQRPWRCAPAHWLQTSRVLYLASE